MTRLRRIGCLALVLLLIATVTPAASRPAERARKVMAVGPEPRAVEAAVAVLKEGGNAVDAAVTMGLLLAVTYPAAGNIGGGGYMLIREADGDAAFIDYRETAPAGASRDMFLDENGDPIPGESLSTYRAVGVPGTVAGMALALEKFGTLPLSRALAPAIRLAREGFEVDRGLARALTYGSRRMGKFPASRAVFYKNGSPLQEGDRLVQEDLARTLQLIADGGPGVFYKGQIAAKLSDDMKAHGGLITKEDLAAYTPLLREPLRGSYRGYEILSAPPSSSGGVALIEMLNMLEPFDLPALGHNSSAYVHLVSEVMKRAFADRARWLGDPDFVDVPVAGLTSPEYAEGLMKSFDPDRSTDVDAGRPPGVPPESPTTTHFTVMDASGTVVANTYTLNGGFGCGAVADGLGFLLNNEMDDFSIKPGVPNLYGLIGGEANSIAPRKRMLSSMTPTIVVQKEEGRPGRPFLALGTPGGSTIITSVLQVLLNVVEFHMELQAAVDAPRFHHQWRPDRIRLEKGGFPVDVQEALRRRGHEVVEGGPRGDVQALQVDAEGGWLLGASDARGRGKAGGF